MLQRASLVEQWTFSRISEWTIRDRYNFVTDLEGKKVRHGGRKKSTDLVTKISFYQAKMLIRKLFPQLPSNLKKEK